MLFVSSFFSSFSFHFYFSFVALFAINASLMSRPLHDKNNDKKPPTFVPIRPRRKLAIGGRRGEIDAVDEREEEFEANPPALAVNDARRRAGFAKETKEELFLATASPLAEEEDSKRVILVFLFFLLDCVLFSVPRFFSFPRRSLLFFVLPLSRFFPFPSSFSPSFFLSSS